MHQFILDMNYLLRVLEPFVTDATAELANGLCERALKTFFAQNKDSRAPMRGDEWYEWRVTAQLDKMETMYPFFLSFE